MSHFFMQVASISTALLLVPVEATAQTCSDALSTLVAATLRPVLAKEAVCSGLRHEASGPFGTKLRLAVDRTDRVELRQLRYCPSDNDSRLEATVYIRCKTSDAAAIKVSLDEQFDFALTVRNNDCTLTAFSVAPRGDIGRIVERLAGLSDRLKEAAGRHIQVLCK